MPPPLASVDSIVMWAELVSCGWALSTAQSSLSVVTHHADVNGGPSDRDRVSSPPEPAAGLHDLQREALSRSQLVGGNTVYCRGGSGEDSDPESVGLGILRC